MKPAYIVLLKNKYLLFFNEKPKKKGNYLNDVKLYKATEKTNISEIAKWTDNKYTHAEITEVEDWE